MLIFEKKRTIEKYREKTKCIIDQYSNYTLKQINKNVNNFFYIDE